MGKMIYEPKHKHKHDYPATAPDKTYEGIVTFKEPDFNSIWQCECGEYFKYRKYFMTATGMPNGRWKKHKPKKQKMFPHVEVPKWWNPPSAALILPNEKVIAASSATIEVRIIPRMVRHRTSGEYEVENRPQYRYASEWFDGEIEGDRNYQKFEMRIYRGNNNR